MATTRHEGDSDDVESDGDSFESLIPPTAECALRCQRFADVTGTNTAIAQTYLQDRAWNLELSVSAYFMEMDDVRSVSTGEGAAVVGGPVPNDAGEPAQDNEEPMVIDVDAIPDAKGCAEMVAKFVKQTDTNSDIAVPCLVRHNWNLESSIRTFRDGSPHRSRPPQPQLTNPARGLTTEVSTSRKRANWGSDDAPVQKKSISEDSASSTRTASSNGDGDSISRSSRNGDPAMPNLGSGDGPGNLQPTLFRLITWNIDGLDQQGIGIRTQEVVAEILRKDPDVVLLQEVVQESRDILTARLGSVYGFHFGEQAQYYTAILLKKQTVQLERSDLFPYPDSTMGRNLLTVMASWSGIPMTFMTSHLESCKEGTKERHAQLALCFQRMTAQNAVRTVLFGGDLNARETLRENDVKIAGGLPANVRDLWVEGGSRPEVRYTWDCATNVNAGALISHGKPRCRFDRLYLRPSQQQQLRFKFFGFAGIDKVPHSQRYASDHWGLMSDFEKV
ncbi:putative Tyrosyl-DNA phosphodiesterase 2 [Hypsibius exemplaris]|uniref:Tyrosyl-DNA phosphodiesterase 2 n=1 Tax=Hypsibius exemplaris TaxID=2072580 RepID=A0A1W0X1D4_HYPEX|nr:putative Tyrosyl-DNA phosphodiesterase 2 [Hypsibius exemplaris]